MRIPAVFASLAALALVAGASEAQVVISQVYPGAAGTGGAGVYNGDFVELFNRGSTPADITGWSVQYAPNNGSFGQFNLKVDMPAAVIPPGRYFLVRTWMPNTSSGLPFTADVAATGTVAQGVGFNLIATAGKIALVSTTDLLPSAICVLPNPSIVDFVGYGNADGCAEGGHSAPPTSVSLAVFRANDGCQDSGDNFADFGAATPLPRNSSSPAHSCLVTNPSGVGSAAPTTHCPGGVVQLSVTVTPGANPTSTGISVSGNFTAIGGSAANPFASQGGGVYAAATTISPDVNVPRDFSVPVSITDAQGRTGLANIVVHVIDCSLRASFAATPPGVCNGETALLSVAVTPGISPASTGVSVTADLTGIGGAANQAISDDGSNGDAVAGDGIYSFAASVPPSVSDGVSVLPVVVADAQGRSVSGSISLAHAACVDSSAPVVISQAYGGGGGAGATYRQSFVELFNRSEAPVDLSPWSLQIATVAGGFGGAGFVPLSGVIQPHSYYLIGLFFGSGGTQDLPQTDLDGFVAMGSLGAKVALVNDQNTLGATCSGASVVDQVSYGQGASCFEGLAQAPGTSNPTAVIRKAGGCQDSNHNIIDFTLGAPTPRNGQSTTNACRPVCRADFNGDGFTDPDDLSDYIACFFAIPACDRADFNADGFSDPDDLADYIALFFGSGC